MVSEGGTRARFRLRRRVVAGVVILLAVLGYGAVVLLYAANARSVNGGSSGSPEEDGVTVVMSPIAVNGPGERISIDARITPPDSLVSDDGLTLTQSISVIIAPIDGTQSVSLDADSLAFITKTVSVPAEGTVENWPFDRYDANIGVVAYTTVDGVKQALPTFVQWEGSLRLELPGPRE